MMPPLLLPEAPAAPSEQVRELWPLFPHNEHTRDIVRDSGFCDE
jgi:hypothetical protein